MATLISLALRRPAHNQRETHRCATRASRNVRNAAQEPATGGEPTHLARSGRAGCAGSVMSPLFAGVFGPERCRPQQLRRNAFVEVWWPLRRCFATRHDVSTCLGAGRGAN